MHEITDVVDAVLVIEPDSSVRGVLAQLLHLEGFAPVTAANGIEAHEFFRADSPVKVILLDLVTPLMGGFSQPRTADAELAKMPVLVLTNSQGRLDVAASFPKPLDFARVIDSIRDCLKAGVR